MNITLVVFSISGEWIMRGTTFIERHGHSTYGGLAQEYIELTIFLRGFMTVEMYFCDARWRHLFQCS